MVVAAPLEATLLLFSAAGSCCSSSEGAACSLRRLPEGFFPPPFEPPPPPFRGTSTGTSISAKSASVTAGGATVAPGASFTATCPTLRISIACGTVCTVLDTTWMTAACGLAQKGQREGPVRRSSRLSVVRGPPSDGDAGSEEKGGHSETAHEEGGAEGEGPLAAAGGGGGESAPAAAEAKKNEEEDEKRRSAVAAAATEVKSALLLLARCIHRRGCRRGIPMLPLLLHRPGDEETNGASPLLLPLGPAAGCCSSRCRRAIEERKKKQRAPANRFLSVFFFLSCSRRGSHGAFFSLSVVFLLASVTRSCVSMPRGFEERKGERRREEVSERERERKKKNNRERALRRERAALKEGCLSQPPEASPVRPVPCSRVERTRSRGHSGGHASVERESCGEKERERFPGCRRRRRREGGLPCLAGCAPPLFLPHSILARASLLPRP